MNMVVIFDDDQFLGICSSYVKACELKIKMSQATDQFVDLNIREIEIDALDKYRIRSFNTGTINIKNGGILPTLEGKDFTDNMGDYTDYKSHNGIFIEVKSYLGMPHLITTLKRLRDEHLNKIRGT